MLIKQFIIDKITINLSACCYCFGWCGLWFLCNSQ